MCSNEYLIIKGRGKRRGPANVNIAGTRPNVESEGIGARKQR